MAGKAIPITPVRTTNDSQPRMQRYDEKASQTFLEGTPVFTEVATGFIIAWAGVVATTKVLGISSEPASNLTTAATPKTLTFGAVPNQASAVNIPRGAPINDGKIGVYLADEQTIFLGALLDTDPSVITDINTIMGLTKDTNNYWYIDRTKTDSIIIVGFDTRQAVGTNGHRLFFRFVKVAQQGGY